MRFKEFLINEIKNDPKYDGGIDVEIDQHGRVTAKKPTSPTPPLKARDSRSEYTASNGIDAGIKKTTSQPEDEKASATSLSPAERERAAARKKKEAKSSPGLLSIAKRMLFRQ